MKWWQTYPITAKAINSNGSKGKDILKEVLKRAVMVSSSLNQTADNLNRKAPQTAPKNPLQ